MKKDYIKCFVTRNTEHGNFAVTGCTLRCTVVLRNDDMKSDVRIQDPKKRPVCSKGSSSTVAVKPGPSRFRRKKQVDGNTVSYYNRNFRSMPKDT